MSELASGAGAIVGVLVPEAGVALQLVGLLEPVIQNGIVALIHRAHKKQLTAADYLALAESQVEGPAPASPAEGRTATGG